MHVESSPKAGTGNSTLQAWMPVEADAPMLGHTSCRVLCKLVINEMIQKECYKSARA